MSKSKNTIKVSNANTMRETNFLTFNTQVIFTKLR